MSITSKTQEVKVVNLSGHNMSHRNTLTGNVGTLIPILTEEVIPNTRCHLKTSFSVKMPPLASETFANIDYRIEAFFVPTRLLVNGFTDVSCGRNRTLPANKQAHLPLLRLKLNTSTATVFNKEFFRPGSLADYLGFKSPKFTVPTDVTFYEDITPLPFLAYHKIYDYWYRNKLVQKEVFADAAIGSTPSGKDNIFAKYIRFDANNYKLTLDPFDNSSMEQVLSDDGVLLFALRQRNFDSDYFTTATTSPQLGDPKEVRVPVQQSEGTLTIAALRAANSLQQFAERNNLCGVDDVNYYKAMYGARLDYGVAQHPVCLGSCSTPVYVNGIFQSAGQSVKTNNPYLSVGAQYGSATCNGIDVVIKDFTAMEPGYIMVLGSLVPKVSYSSGIRRYLKHHIDGPSGSDIANPILQNIGPQPIYGYETDGAMNNNMDNSVFGYQCRFAEWVSHPDEIHGQFIDGNTLESFVLQRNIEHAQLNTEFLQIPKDYLNQILAVSDTGSPSGFSYWVDMLHSWSVVNPLADFVIPSLQDPAYEHGHEVTIRKNGASMI